MANQSVHPLARPRHISAKGKRVFLFIHGYTGSPSDFNGLGPFLHKRFKATVKIPRLLGHGTQVQDLNSFTYSDFYNQLTKEIKKELKAKKEVILIGYSYGALLALALAARFPVKGVIAISASYKLKFPLSMVGPLRHVKQYWKKHLNAAKRERRKNSFYYKYMNANIVTLLKEARRDLHLHLNKVHCPVLILNARHERVASYKGALQLEKAIPSPIKKTVLVDCKNHDLLYSEAMEEAYAIIDEFITENSLFA